MNGAKPVVAPIQARGSKRGVRQAVCTGIVGLLVWTSSAPAAPVYGDPTRAANSGGGAISTVAGDLNNDGRKEFISTASKDSGGKHFRIYSYDPATQGFVTYDVLSPAVVATRQDRFGGDLEVGDMNQDGFLDIIVPESDNGNGAGRLSWFENPDGNLAGVWTEHVISTWTGNVGDSAEHMSEVAVGDIDGNGWLDVVTRDVSHGCFILLRGNGGVGWQTRRFVATNPREGLVLWNPDGDGDLDILINGVWFETPADPLNGTYLQRTISALWYPAGNGGAAISDYACQVGVGDFNADGRMDVAITNSEELSNDGSTASKPKGVRVYLAPPDPVNGAWTEVILNGLNYSWHSLEIADLDLDGDLDVVSGISMVGVDTAPANILAFLNNGSGTVFAQQTIDVGQDNFSADVFIYNPTLADADGDGDADLFAPDNWNSGPIRYYQNTTTAPGPPATPASLEAIPLSTSRIELNWSASSSNETGFSIERQTGAEAFAQVAETGQGVTVFADAGLAAGTGYSYRIRAFNTFGDSAATAAVSATTATNHFLAWQTQRFGPAPDPSVAGELQDPDFDSVVNLLEYFLGTDPNVAGAAGLQVTSAGGRLQAGFTRSVEAVDVAAVVQGADSLAGPWLDLARSTGGGSFIALVPGVTISETGTGPVRSVQVSDAYLMSDAAHPIRFVRLAVTH